MALLQTLNAFLLEQKAAGRSVVLVIDEAQNLSPEVLEQIRLISNLETETHKLLQIVLAGQPELLSVLAREELRQLNQRITVRFHLLPMEFASMQSYIDHRMEHAGRYRAAQFSKGALKRIFRYSRGIPRLVNVACDRALLIGFTEEQRVISSRMAAQAIAEVSGGGRRALWRIWERL
jgi:general secretion pathway protein A